MVGKANTMSRHEVPIQHVEGTGIVASLLLHIVFAGAAVVAHAVDVGAAGHVRLGRHHATVAPGGHADDVGERHPFVGVSETRPEPAIERRRCHTEQRGEVGLHHQTRNVMHATRVAHRANGVRQASHLTGSRRWFVLVARLAIGSPEPHRQWEPRVEGIRASHAGHQVPVDPAHIFAPPEDLPDETLHTRQLHQSFAISALCSLNHFTRMQQADVDC